MVEVVGSTAPSTLSVTMLGDPPVQRHMRIAWRRFLFRGWGSHGNGARGTGNAYLYDPSSADKIRYTAVVKAALAELGVSGNLPYFATGGPLVLQVKFNCPRPVHAIQAFPCRKDLDNMVKFLMDACHVVLYQNDTVVVELVAKKVFPLALVPSKLRGWRSTLVPFETTLRVVFFKLLISILILFQLNGYSSML
jgi:Holliday junction resolvase RusA-like endonuclease